MRTITALFVGLGSIGTRHLKNLANLCADRGWALQADALRSDLSRPLRDGVAELLHAQYTDMADAPAHYDLVFITNPTSLHADALTQAADERAERLEADAIRYRNDAMARSVEHGVIESLRTWAAQLAGGGATLKDVAADYNARLTEHKAAGARIESELAAALDFIDAAWGAGNEMTLALNEMTMNKVLSAFIAKHGCDAYYDRSETLMLDARAKRFAERLAQLEA